MGETKTVTILSSCKERKATIVAIGETLFGITKHCMSQNDFKKIFPNDDIKNWEFIKREEIIKVETIKDHLDQLSRTAINWNVRRLN